MFIDKQAEFSNSQAITAAAISTNQYDNGAAPIRDLGGALQGIFLVVQVDTAFSGGTGTELEITLESDSTSNLATAPTVHYSSGAIPAASLVPGTLLVIPLPIGEYQEYVGLRYTPDAAFGAGAISAFLTTTPQTWRAYPNARLSS